MFHRLGRSAWSLPVLLRPHASRTCRPLRPPGPRTHIVKADREFWLELPLAKSPRCCAERMFGGANLVLKQNLGQLAAGGADARAVKLAISC